MPEPESTNTMFHDAFVNIGDGEYALRTTPSSTDSASPATSGPIAESGFGSGAVTAPVAGTTIATHQPPSSAAGKLHKIDVTAWLSGTGAPAATDGFNIAFKYGDTTISDLPLIPDKHIPVQCTFYFNAAEGVAFSVVSGADAGTADVTYNAMIVATRVVS